MSRLREGIWVPRWMAVLLGILALVVVVWRIQHPPAWTVQRLDAPAGDRRAVLERIADQSDHYFRIRLKPAANSLWKTVLYFGPITNSFRVDLGERLRWSSDAGTLSFELAGETMWRFDVERWKQTWNTNAAPLKKFQGLEEREGTISNDWNFLNGGKQGSTSVQTIHAIARNHNRNLNLSEYEYDYEYE